MIPLIQKELDTFRVSVWNTHRIRAQKDALLPNGVPNHIYNFPEKYDLEECGKYTVYHYRLLLTICFFMAI